MASWVNEHLQLFGPGEHYKHKHMLYTHTHKLYKFKNTHTYTNYTDIFVCTVHTFWACSQIMKHRCVNVFCTNCAAMIVAKVSSA